MYGNESQTGVTTPRSSASLRQLTLNHGSLETTFLIPTGIHFQATVLKEQFNASLPPPTDELAQDDEPSSVEELVARYLGFVAGKVDEEEEQRKQQEKEPDWDAAGETQNTSSYTEVLKLTLNEFERAFLRGNEVHALAATLPGIDAKKLEVIRSYYHARRAANRRSIKEYDSALLRAVSDRKAKIYSIFGGQGNIEEYFEELRELWVTYPGFVDELITKSAELLQSLSLHPAAEKLYPKGLDVLTWLRKPETTPDVDYLISAPVSFPLIGLVQLAHYQVTCRVFGMDPATFLSRISGATGHSQGVVLAAATAAATTWESWLDTSAAALTILFWIGARSQQVFPRTSLTPTMLRESVDHGEGTPTPMLSIRDLPLSEVQRHIEKTNHYLPQDRHIGISLINSPRNLVVAGPPQSLCGLNTQLRKVKAPTGLDQNRIPYTDRKVRFVNRFLPITAPFHSKYLGAATELLDADLKDIVIDSKALAIPVFDTNTGKDLRTEVQGNVVPALIRMITRDVVNWETATVFPGATHILDFGPGGISGLGILTNRNKEGTGVRVILAGSVNGTLGEVGYKSELFDRDEANAVKYAIDWVREFGPRLITTTNGKTYVDTKLSRWTGLPPIIVAGMTPATVPWDFAAATMNAGYQIELAGGGYFEPRSMTDAIKKIEGAIPAGRGINVNLIYVNPRAMQWQTPLLAKLRSEGVPIEGMTIGAGVPSLEVAQEYIDTLGLKHIAFKPGSMDAIQSVINIAKANPRFPVLLQWTGGRGGGHHSFEDFHQPVLQMYGRIRRCDNIILIAGSGFGGAEDTYPYITGDWSKKYGYPPMPFDGCLFGSRMMVAKEAHTSPAAKQAIVDAPGVDDSEWEKSYKGAVGGVITVRSEMGEPIHKLATRGVLFWSEMDQKIFSLPKEKRVAELKKNRDYIIKRLNADFQKPWFGKNAAGKAVDVDEMTYAEVVRRMVELMYISHQKRWIDWTFARLTGDWMRRVEERFTSAAGRPSLLQSYDDLREPHETVERFLAGYPEAETQFVNAQDVQHFLALCIRPIQKPVVFVPALNNDFEFYFKKDSLWQSEDLEAVPDQDVGRTCILQGPTAARYSTVLDEPIKDILDNIHNGHIEALSRDYYNGNAANIPGIQYFGGQLGRTSGAPPAAIEGLSVVEEAGPDRTIFRVSATATPSADAFLAQLAGPTRSWRHALLTSEVVVQGQKYQTNPIKRLFAPVAGLEVEIEEPNRPQKTVITVREQVRPNQLVEVVRVSFSGENQIVVSLIKDTTALGKPVALPFKFTYHPECGYAPIREVMDDRNDRIKEFYWRAWFGADELDLDVDIKGRFDGGTTTITGEDINNFVHAVGNTGEAFVDRPDKVMYAPMDFAIVIGWKAITKPIFPRTIDGDLLKLVHLSNGFRMVPGAEPLKRGDEVSTTARINAVINQESGKMVEVCGTLERDGKPVMEVTSQFLYRGTYTDFENTFQLKTETPVQVHLATSKDVAVLRAKEWFSCDDMPSDIDLLGQTLTFRLQSLVRFKNRTVFSSVETRGEVLLELPTKAVIQIASVEYVAGLSHGNPVIDYLTRTGVPIDQPMLFENAIPLSSKSSPLQLKAPASNENYARVSGDYNPIHVSRVFSEYANLPGTITHGMYSSAAVRSLVETWAAENDIGRVRSFHASLVGMVLPNDDLLVKLQHVGMVSGRKIIRVEAINRDTDEKVLAGEAEIEQPRTAYIFTGQGSQEQGMGMDLYDSSPVAKAVWDRADTYLMDNYGFSITHIVRNNPKELTIYFGGPRGQAIRDNYMAMTFETVSADGTVKSERIFKGIDDKTTSHTYRSPTGLLSATQFTQPALTLMEKASFEDMKSKGLVPRESTFAGHSLGEYSALAALADVMPIESLVSVVFYRGLTMQVAVERDHDGRSNYSMCAVNPSRISAQFDETALRFVVSVIAETTGWLLEIVNFNVVNQQYVCAGDNRALDTLTAVTNYIKFTKLDVDQLRSAPAETKAALVKIVNDASKNSAAKAKAAGMVKLERGAATIPLKGIDVPFHSTFLRSGVKPFRSFLLKKINKTTINPSKLVGKYIPNLTARPFEITYDYFKMVQELTGSPKIKHVLENWEELTGEKAPEGAASSSSSSLSSAAAEEDNSTPAGEEDEDRVAGEANGVANGNGNGSLAGPGTAA
jgi:fatty acid synthase subunit beta